VAAIFIAMCLAVVRPHDFWWHVRVGEWIVENGRVPDRDLFSFTRAGEPFIYQMWLAEVVLSTLFRLGDLPLVILFNAVLITTAYVLVLHTAYRKVGAYGLRWAAVATAATAAAGLHNWGVRPQAFSFPLFAFTLWLLERNKDQLGETDPTSFSFSRSFWLLPPLFALWANLHGGFMMGLALVSAYVLSSLQISCCRRSRVPFILLIIGVLCANAVLLTPAGTRVMPYILSFVRHPVTQQFNVEWMPPTVRDSGGQFFFGFVIVWLTVLVLGRYRPNVHEILRYLVFGLLALTAVRHTSWFAIVAAPGLAAALTNLAGHFRTVGLGRQRANSRLNLVFIVAVFFIVLLSLPWLRMHLPLPEARRSYVSSETPLEAVGALCRLPDVGRVFHSEAYGSYLIWACPSIPVFLDTRFELYPPEQWYDYIAVGRGRYDWETILARYGITTLFLERIKHQSLIQAVSASQKWECIYTDDRSMIFELRSRL